MRDTFTWGIFVIDGCIGVTGHEDNYIGGNSIRVICAESTSIKGFCIGGTFTRKAEIGDTKIRNVGVADATGTRGANSVSALKNLAIHL